MSNTLPNLIELPVPRRMKVGDTIDGHVVTALVADTAVHLLYQVRNSANGELGKLYQKWLGADLPKF